MALTVTKKIDAVVKSARIMGIGIQELFLNEKDWDEVQKEAVNNNVSGDGSNLGKTLMVTEYESEIGIITLKKKI